MIAKLLFFGIIVAGLWLMIDGPWAYRDVGCLTSDAEITYHTILSLEVSLMSFYVDCARYPSSDEGLRALVQRPDGEILWKGPYLSSDWEFVDSWGNPLVYIFPGREDPHRFELFSYGPDGFESGDDIDRR